MKILPLAVDIDYRFDITVLRSLDRLSTLYKNKLRVHGVWNEFVFLSKKPENNWNANSFPGMKTNHNLISFSFISNGFSMNILHNWKVGEVAVEIKLISINKNLSLFNFLGCSFFAFVRLFKKRKKRTQGWLDNGHRKIDKNHFV